jgi:ubiquinone/menaquinone biosynthesis C-methylase UbiE
MSDDSRPAYDRIAENYDRTRRPAGMPEILRALDPEGHSIADRRVLDAGCGTGSYCLALAQRVGAVVGLDISPGMIAVARKKRDRSNVCFIRGSITRLPFRDAAFDGVLVNQALHHVVGTKEGTRAAHRAALREVSRVLKPGGTLVIGTSSQEQLRDGFWFYRLLPDAAARLRQRFLPLADLESLLAREGFRCRDRLIPHDALLQGDAYFDAGGPFDAAWRDGDSVWATASEAERARGLARLREYDERGELEARFREWDARRPAIGQMTFVSACRTGAKTGPVSSGKPG